MASLTGKVALVKGSGRGLGQSCANLLARYGEAGIRVNAAAPGPMWTPLLRETVARNPGHAEAHVAHVPLRRICEPEEVAGAAVWLCSPAAWFVTGVTLSADGGYVLGPA